jgi:hypothetical protein
MLYSKTVEVEVDTGSPQGLRIYNQLENYICVGEILGIKLSIEFPS